MYGWVVRRQAREVQEAALRDGIPYDIAAHARSSGILGGAQGDFERVSFRQECRAFLRGRRRRRLRGGRRRHWWRRHHGYRRQRRRRALPAENGQHQARRGRQPTIAAKARGAYGCGKWGKWWLHARLLGRRGAYLAQVGDIAGLCGVLRGREVFSRLLRDPRGEGLRQGLPARAAGQRDPGCRALQIPQVGSREFAVHHVQRPLLSRRQALGDLLDQQVHHGFVGLTLRTRI